MKIRITLLLLVVTIGFQQAQSQAKRKGAPIACTTIEPQMTFKLDTSKARGLADHYYLWDNGQTVYVKIMDGSDDKKQMIERYAKEWEQYANIYFIQRLRFEGASVTSMAA